MCLYVGHTCCAQDASILFHAHSCTVHGALEEALIRESKATALKDQLVTVTIACPEDASSKDINKKLPGEAAVGV